jgi:DNA-binding transcriptional LysR family regulator
MSVDPRLLRPFVALADELHFGRAAERLHVTQPALSQQIARLERQAGVRLFARTRTRVELTEAGAAMLEPARAAVAAAGAAAATADAFARGERGELAIGISPGAHYPAQVVLAAFARRRPQVRVRARQDNSGVLTEQVAAGRLALALAFAAAPAGGVAREVLREEPAVLAVAGSHRLAGRASVALAELRDETFALVDALDGPGYNAAVVERCREAGFEPRRVEAPQGPMAWETAVRSGGCVGLTTRSAAPATARDVTLLELDPPVSFPLDLLLPAGPVPPAAAAFAALARAIVSGSAAA